MKERLIKEMIFCGTPEVYFMGLGKLHAQVSRAISYISGLQQPPHSNNETQARMDEYEQEIGWKEVETCVQDIVCALLGSDYYLAKTIPPEVAGKDHCRGHGQSDGAAMATEAEEEIARQTKHACNSDSIYAEHRCCYVDCEARGEYIVCDGFGRRLIVCNKHYETSTYDGHFK